MKKILSILLVSVFFYNIIGFYLNYSMEQFRIKEEVKEKIISSLPESELTILKISSSDKGKISWLDEGKEFRYKGEMFDLVKTKQGTDTTCYYCFCDSRENKLLSSLDKLVREQSDRSQSRSVHKNQVINYFFQETSFTQFNHESSVQYPTYVSGHQFIDTDVLTPPPRS